MFFYLQQSSELQARSQVENLEITTCNKMFLWYKAYWYSLGKNRFPPDARQSDTSVNGPDVDNTILLVKVNVIGFDALTFIVV